jgi:replicative DNA helicase
MSLPRISDLPTNLEAEQAVLGAILVNNLAFHGVSEFLRVEHFADPLHAALYDASAKLLNRGQAVNPFSLKAYAESLPGLPSGGVNRYLAELASGSVVVADALSMARVVRDAALRRGLVAIGNDAMTEACYPQPEDTAADQIARVEKRLYELAEGAADSDFAGFSKGLTSAVKGAEAAHKREGGLSGVTTGLRSLDRLLGGLHRSDLIILAARPSMGKSSLASNISVSAALAWRTEDTDAGPVTIDGARVGFISLEMSADQLATRIVSERAMVSSAAVRKGNMNAAEFDRFLNAAREFESMPMWIDDTPGQTLSAIRARARRLKRQHGCELLVIDYLQLIEPDDRRRNGNRVEDVSTITRGLKGLAKELDVPVLALSQLSRAVESRENKRPQLSDLRESGSIEQDADVVMFIYREAYYLARQGLDVPADIENRAEILVEKQRHGPIGTITTKFEAWLTRFSDLEGA